ncbi:hypothetical protein H4V97_000179 [Flavobacterium sp. CG_23.5]|nr:hypothetical protein [Flavobacterium sp. CG_23.5]
MRYIEYRILKAESQNPQNNIVIVNKKTDNLYFTVVYYCSPLKQ